MGAERMALKPALANDVVQSGIGSWLESMLECI